MRRLVAILILILNLTFCVSPTLAETSTPNTGDQIQAFLFSYTTSNLVLPITPTCPDPLTLTQLTTTNAKTSDPRAPYTMVLLVHEQLVDGSGMAYERTYSASVGVGDLSHTQEIQHPWGNGTQFIGCIWSANGVSGGCQDLHTVVPSANTQDAYATPSSTCRRSDVLESWVPPLNETLDVDVSGLSGEVAINAWPAACSDLQFTPKNGTPPYTLLIAPAAHPPVNITSTTKSPMNYTVRLTHGQAFMVGMYDSAGNSWAYGPLHSGDAEDLSCLAVATGEKSVQRDVQGYGIGALAGGIGGAFVAGALGAATLMWYFGRRNRSRLRSDSTANLYDDPRPGSYRTSSGSVYGKPQAYTDQSPQADFDTPATLYDPLVPDPSSAYPAPPPHKRTISYDGVLSRPPMPAASQSFDTTGYTNPYDRAGDSGRSSYRDNIGLEDFRPTPPRGRPRSTSDRSSLKSAGNSPGHIQDLSWPSASSGQIRNPARRSTASITPVRMTNAASSASRPDSLNTSANRPSDRADDEPSSPSSLNRRSRNVYVVHSDGGGADVHIQLPESGANVIELPPDYRPMPMPEPSPAAVRDRPNRGATGKGGSGGGLPYTSLEPTRGRASGLSGVHVDMGADELRARAEAAMREKRRPTSGK
ncbi:hypothetical protein IAR55_005279 [Kwoniella newhampshirensis]|uniref:Uncharacterized protein n=1 Tax=Kwoniella newhampshirensis TaxID=1651941 RepID=A0AAW0YKG9_9TREE